MLASPFSEQADASWSCPARHPQVSVAACFKLTPCVEPPVAVSKQQRPECGIASATAAIKQQGGSSANSWSTVRPLRCHDFLIDISSFGCQPCFTHAVAETTNTAAVVTFCYHTQNAIGELQYTLMISRGVGNLLSCGRASCWKSVHGHLLFLLLSWRGVDVSGHAITS